MDQQSITQADYEKIGRFIYGFQRHADPERLRAAAAGALAPELAERALALVRRYDAALDALQRNTVEGMPDVVSDDELQAILAHAAAFVQDSGWTHGGNHSR